MTNPNSINFQESTKQPSKYSNFVNNTKKAVRDTLIKTGIAASTMAPMATTTTSTVLPASVNTITAIAPTASSAISTISLGTAAGLLTACGGGEDGPDTPVNPIDKKDTVAPTINVNLSEVDITGGKEIRIDGNKLYIGGELVASRSDDKTANCNISLSLNGKAITSGSSINDEGTLTITVKDNANNSKSIDIKIISNSPISGLESLKNLNMQVDQEVNLLNGVTLKNGAELVKTEIEMNGQKIEIADPHHYTPEIPSTCSIILTVKDKNGEIKEYRVDDLTIKALEYNEATIDEADMINEKYPWYNNLQQSTKDFVYPHLLSSYAACNWSKLDNRAHIIQGEIPDTDDVEKIGESDIPGDHAYEGYYRIRALSPDAAIKGCGGRWDELENYINDHPDKVFLVSCAADTGGGATIEKLNKNLDTQPQKNILNKENVIVITANGNRVLNSGKRKVYNENIKDGNRYKSASINSKLNNKITVVGYNSRGEDNFFAPIEYGGLKSTMPVGYDKDKGNIVMPMIPLVGSNNREDTDTSSSFPTAVTSGIIGNAISIIMTSHPGITAEDAMTIICDSYLREETFQYKDAAANGALVDGGKRYFIQMQDLLNNELLHSNKIQHLALNSDNVELPNGQGICYSGLGIQFEYEGKRYTTTKTNQSILDQALKSGKVKRYWDKKVFKKYGGKDSVKFNAYIVDKAGKRIPDLHLQIDKSVN